MLKVLNPEEKQTTKPLWETIFKEDSQNFIDYYYKNKIKSNIILGKLIDNKIVSMLHLNPYTISFNNHQVLSYYIVGVATSTAHRKKGYMRKLLLKSFDIMHKENVPFTFLMPAKKEIYLPFDFEYIYNHNHINFLEDLNIKKEPLSTEKDFEEMATYLNKNLSLENDLFAIRDKAYIKTLQKELKSENGEILKTYLKDKFIGYYLYWGIKTSEIRSVYSQTKYTKTIKTEPKIMSRIINIKSFLENFTLKETYTKELSLYIKIKDSLIPSNNATFKWKLSAKSSKLIRCKSSTELKEVLQININTLATWLFGYIPLENLISDKKITCENQNILSNLSLIKVLKGVFLDEIV